MYGEQELSSDTSISQLLRPPYLPFANRALEGSAGCSLSRAAALDFAIMASID